MGGSEKVGDDSTIIDTNVIVRFLVGDNVAQVKQARDFFKKSQKQTIYLPDVVFTEVIFVLLSYYELDKFEVIDKMRVITNFEKFRLNRMLLSAALDIYERESISFVDSYILAHSHLRKVGGVFTFDKRLISASK